MEGDSRKHVLSKCSVRARPRGENSSVRLGFLVLMFSLQIHVFVVLFQGAAIDAKVRKISNAFGARLFACPESATARSMLSKVIFVVCGCFRSFVFFGYLFLFPLCSRTTFRMCLAGCRKWV